MLLAEDVLLLLTDDATGKPAVDSTTMDLALAGAVLLELAALGHVDVAIPGEAVKPGRVVVRRAGPAGDSSHETMVRRALHDVLVTGRTATSTEAGLVAILLAVDKLHVVLATGLSRRELKSRARAVAEGSFAGEAVRKAIEAINAAIISTVVVTSVVASGASG